MVLIVNILFIAVIAMLVITWGRKSAVWGGATVGLIIGGLIGLFTGSIFIGIKNGVTIGGTLGVIAEGLGVIGNRLSRKKQEVQK